MKSFGKKILVLLLIILVLFIAGYAFYLSRCRTISILPKRPVQREILKSVPPVPEKAAPVAEVKKSEAPALPSLKELIKKIIPKPIVIEKPALPEAEVPIEVPKIITQCPKPCPDNLVLDLKNLKTIVEMEEKLNMTERREKKLADITLDKEKKCAPWSLYLYESGRFKLEGCATLNDMPQTSNLLNGVNLEGGVRVDF